MAHGRITLLIFVTLQIASGIHCQNPTYIQYTMAHGLPTNYVYNVMEDNKGNIWVYTENGICRFDGNEFHCLGTKHGLHSTDVIMAVQQSKSERIWIWCFGDVPAYIENDSIFRLTDKPKVNGMFFDHTNIYYYTGQTTFIASEDPVATRDRSSLSMNAYRVATTCLEKAISSNADNSTYKILPNKRKSQNTVLITHDLFESIDSIDFLHLGNYETITNHCSGWSYLLQNDQIDSLYIGDGGVSLPNASHIPTKIKLIYFPKINKYRLINWHSKNVTEFRLESNIDINFNDVVPFYSSTAIILNSNNSESQIFSLKFSDSIARPLHIPHAIGKYDILGTYLDSNQNLWLGTRSHGLILIPKAFDSVRKLNNSRFKNEAFEVIHRTQDGRLYTITESSGIYEITKDSLRHLNQVPLSLSHKSSVAVENNIFTSHSQFLYSINPINQQTSQIKHPSPISEAYLAEDMMYDEKSRLILALRRNSPYAYSPVSGEMVDFNFPCEEIYLFPSNKQIDDPIVLCENGLYGLYSELTVTLPMPYYEVETIHQYKANIFIGTKYSGLYMFNGQNKSWSHALNNTRINNILTPTDSTLLVALNEGIYYLKFVADSITPISYYGANRGFRGGEINDIHQLNQNIYAATDNGFFCIAMEDTIQEMKNGYLSVNSFKVNNKSTPPTSSDLYELQYTENNISVSYNLRSYESFGNQKYYTKLIPAQSEWRESTGQLVEYHDLRPGTYEFLLAAADINNTRYQLEPIKFVIRPPFWRTWWFIALSISILIWLVYSSYRKSIKKRTREIEKDKSAEVRLANLKIEALKSQMNPHFIFNALGSIQYYIQVENIEKADYYLTQFALLMRKYLDVSREKYTTVKEEVKLLSMYIDLEAMRLDHSFSWNIRVSEAIDEDQDTIPAMLVQPLVENAIKHGLTLRRDGLAHLKIDFFEVQQDIHIRISDNGIGIEKSQRNSSPIRTSRGMEMIREKIKMYGASNLAQITLRTRPIDRSNLQYPGTQVEIIVKYARDKN